MLVCCPRQWCGTISRNLFWITKSTALHNRCLLKFKLFASFLLSFGVWVKVMQYYGLHVCHICMSINYHLTAWDIINRLPWNMVSGWVLLKYVDAIQFICYNERNITNLRARAHAYIHTHTHISCFFFNFSTSQRLSTFPLKLCQYVSRTHWTTCISSSVNIT